MMVEENYKYTFCKTRRDFLKSMEYSLMNPVEWTETREFFVSQRRAVAGLCVSV